MTRNRGAVVSVGAGREAEQRHPAGVAGMHLEGAL